jgi:hypothetical protein
MSFDQDVLRLSIALVLALGLVFDVSASLIRLSLQGGEDDTEAAYERVGRTANYR